MKYNNKFNIQWRSVTERDDILMQAVKDVIPHFVDQIFLEDEEAIGHHTHTTIELVDTLPIDEATGSMPLGTTQIPVQMVMKKTRELVIKVRVGASIKHTLNTVAHELMHAHQSYSGRLVCGFIDPETTIEIWEGKAFSTKVIQYKDHPWEIEANKVADEFMSNCDEYLSFCFI